MLDDGFGTVEKVSDAPLTVRYTIDRGRDLVGRHARHARRPAAGVGGAQRPARRRDARARRAGRDHQRRRARRGGRVRGGVAGARAGASRCRPWTARRSPLVYATPVPDWQVALDVNVPAHVVGQIALGRRGPDRGGRRGLDGDHRRGQGGAELDLRDVAHGVRRRRPRAARRPGGQRRPVRRRRDRAGRARRAGAQRRVRRATAPRRYDRVVVRSDLEPLEQVEALAAGHGRRGRPDGHAGTCSTRWRR